jgi:hypothetical protein
MFMNALHNDRTRRLSQLSRPRRVGGRGAERRRRS